MCVETPHSIYARFLSALSVLIHTFFSFFFLAVATCRIFSCGMWDLGP